MFICIKKYKFCNYKKKQFNQPLFSLKVWLDKNNKATICLLYAADISALVFKLFLCLVIENIEVCRCSYYLETQFRKIVFEDCYGPHKGKSFLTWYISFETNGTNDHASLLRIVSRLCMKISNCIDLDLLLVRH